VVEIGSHMATEARAIMTGCNARRLCRKRQHMDKRTGVRITNGAEPDVMLQLHPD
jgi:hypothetical protein